MQPIPSNPIGLNRANHVGISVSDLDASIRFYEALTGTKIVNKDVIGGPRMAAVQGLPKVLIRYANVHLANLNIDLLQYDEPKVKKARMPLSRALLRSVKGWLPQIWARELMKKVV